MSDETKVEKSTNVDGKSVSQPIAKPHVVRSPKSSKIVDLKVLYDKDKPLFDLSSEALVFYFGQQESIGIYTADLIEFLLSRKNDKLNCKKPEVDYKYEILGSKVNL